MVKIPSSSFKIASVDESHPFVKEARRPRKHYEPCWCGSGRKYKKCHQIREQEKPYSLGRALREQKEVFWKNRDCMHPKASPESCQGYVIDAHSIQRKGPLSKITNRKNHVCHFEVKAEEMVVKEIGWKKVSIFPGFCSGHDSKIFGDLERDSFTGAHDQCVLQAFRSVCNELYKKRAALDSLEFQRIVIDRGCDTGEQITRQLSIAKNIEGQRKSLEELAGLWEKFDQVVSRKEYSRFASKAYFFEGELCITSSGALHAEFDFKGNVLSNMWDLKEDAEILSHSVMNTDNGGAIIFTWLYDEESPKKVVSSFDDILNDEKADIFVQYCFLNCENTFFSKDWWDRLGPSLQKQLKEYAGTLFYEGGAFIANKHRLVNWKFI